jgi:hypothetical protein
MAKIHIILVGFCLAGGNASAGDAILSCKSIIEDADRLKCFDSALESLEEQNQVDSPAATAETETIDSVAHSVDVSNQESSVTPDQAIQGIIERLANSDFEGALAETKSAIAGKGLLLNDAQIEKLRTATSDAVSPLPGSATLENLAGYQILLVLEPDNQKWQKSNSMKRLRLPKRLSSFGN